MKKISIATILLFTFFVIYGADGGSIPAPAAKPSKTVPAAASSPSKTTPRALAPANPVIATPPKATSKATPKVAQPQAPAAPALAASASAKRMLRYVQVGTMRYLRLSDVALLYGFAIVQTPGGFSIRGTNSRIDFPKNGRAGSINGIKVTYLFAPIVRNDVMYISEMDFNKVVDPSMRRVATGRHTVKTIMIDPGHGGSDPGAPGPVANEKQINLEISKKLAEKLRLLGFRVILTRYSDTTLSLQNRAEMCEKHKPDLFISIHCNSSTSKQVRGLEVFTMTPADAPSSGDTKTVKTVAPSNRFDSNSYLMAYEVQRMLVNYVKFEDRGVKHGRLYVLRNAVCPAILVECGFLSHPSEGRLLADKNMQDRIASSILSGIVRYAARVR